MLTILRFVGLMNAAVWLGGAVFFSFAAAPAVFQPEMKKLFQDYYVGIIAQTLLERYFSFNLVCGMIALMHALAGWFGPGRERRGLLLALLVGLYTLCLVGTFWFQPKLKSLFQTKYTAPTVEQRERAGRSFRRWHGASQAVNLLVLGGLVIYVWRMARPVPEMRPMGLGRFGGLTNR